MLGMSGGADVVARLERDPDLDCETRVPVEPLVGAHPG
jgi:hypothetical protein